MASKSQKWLGYLSFVLSFSLSYFQEADKDCSIGLEMVKRCEDRDDLNFHVLKTEPEFLFWYSDKQTIS